MTKESLFGKSLLELEAVAIDLGLPKFIGGQLAYWLYQSNVSFEEQFSNISKKNRELIFSHYQLGLQLPIKVQVSEDGTKKYLYPALEGKFIEAAYMPDLKRNTLCVSTQVGCKMGCLFCMTAKQGFQGNLSAGDVLNQLRSLPEREAVTNIVFMGMGEPFDNTANVLKTLEILTASWGFGMSSRKITVSTIGIIPGIRAFLENSPCNLAISLHSPFDDERRKLMPVQHVYPIKDVIETIHQYDLSRYRKLSFEYILFKDINDTPRHVKEMARLLNKLRCRVNLLRFHPVPNAPFVGSDEATILAFQQSLKDKGIMTTVRKSRGLDIDAACGLLSTKVMGEGDGVRVMGG
ncbi:MAG: 23S rRNA (adenine(2503)-C(2))-methyltransferase RlmN [Bacteroidota bacterium]